MRKKGDLETALDEILSFVEGQLCSYEIHGTSVREIAWLVLAGANLLEWRARHGRVQMGNGEAGDALG